MQIDPTTAVRADQLLRQVTKKADAGLSAKEGSDRGADKPAPAAVSDKPARPHSDVNGNGWVETHDVVLVRLGVAERHRPVAPARNDAERRYREIAEETTYSTKNPGEARDAAKTATPSVSDTGGQGSRQAREGAPSPASTEETPTASSAEVASS